MWMWTVSKWDLVGDEVLLLARILWAKCLWTSQKSYIEALTPNMSVFGDSAFMKVIRVN